MLTIVHKDKKHYIHYNPNITLQDLKQELSILLNIIPINIKIYHNNLLLERNSSMVSELFEDNSQLTIIEDQGDMMSNMMSNPLVGDMLKDPNLLNNMFEMFPEVKKEMESNSELKDMLNNGSFQEEMQKMANDPEYLKHAMRNADLAIGKLQNMEGGSNILNSMMHNVRDPFEKAFKQKGSVNINQGETRHEIVDEPLNLGGKKKKTENLFLKYVDQLKDLRNYGFKDIRKNTDALEKCNGDVEQAILLLTSQE